MTDKPMSPERLDKAIERLNEFVAGARGPYTNIVSDMKTVLAEIDAMRERAEKAEAAAQAEVMASGRAVVKMDVDALKNRLIAAERQRDEALAALEKARGDALEEAARACELIDRDDAGNVPSGDGWVWYGKSRDHCAKNIRSLKDQTP